MVKTINPCESRATFHYAVFAVIVTGVRLTHSFYMDVYVRLQEKL